jgi:hypothetical protein
MYQKNTKIEAAARESVELSSAQYPTSSDGSTVCDLLK